MSLTIENAILQAVGNGNRDYMVMQTALDLLWETSSDISELQKSVANMLDDMILHNRLIEVCYIIPGNTNEYNRSFILPKGSMLTPTNK